MTKGAPFPRAFRLLRKKEFRAVFDGGRSRADGDLIVYANPREAGGPTRLGLVVSRKFGPSVARNAFKRRLREAFRLSHGELPESHDLVVLPARPAIEPDFDSLKASLLTVSRRAARARSEQGPRPPRRHAPGARG